ncbi:uncharacterized protein LTR77_010989 [Saxophila tyrrhenica]|uniref:Uncharacterized protein n=1 Tax=Saxophila tyrrhenica TaxID=1690608 RepID=A0AAV9NU45_9PEZI|nr:hypothetical protein LTR77_010989 [Saxophila tyrrhenica]
MTTHASVPASLDSVVSSNLDSRSVVNGSTTLGNAVRGTNTRFLGVDKEAVLKHYTDDREDDDAVGLAYAPSDRTLYPITLKLKQFAVWFREIDTEDEKKMATDRLRKEMETLTMNGFHHPVPQPMIEEVMRIADDPSATPSNTWFSWKGPDEYERRTGPPPEGASELPGSEMEGVESSVHVAEVCNSEEVTKALKDVLNDPKDDDCAERLEQALNGRLQKLEADGNIGKEVKLNIPSFRSNYMLAVNDVWKVRRFGERPEDLKNLEQRFEQFRTNNRSLGFPDKFLLPLAGAVQQAASAKADQDVTPYDFDDVRRAADPRGDGLRQGEDGYEEALRRFGPQPEETGGQRSEDSNRAEAATWDGMASDGQATAEKVSSQQPATGRPQPEETGERPQQATPENKTVQQNPIFGGYVTLDSGPDYTPLGGKICGWRHWGNEGFRVMVQISPEGNFPVVCRLRQATKAQVEQYQKTQGALQIPYADQVDPASTQILKHVEVKKIRFCAIAPTDDPGKKPKNNATVLVFKAPDDEKLHVTWGSKCPQRVRDLFATMYKLGMGQIAPADNKSTDATVRLGTSYKTTENQKEGAHMATKTTNAGPETRTHNGNIQASVKSEYKQTPVPAKSEDISATTEEKQAPALAESQAKQDPQITELKAEMTELKRLMQALLKRQNDSHAS